MKQSRVGAALLVVFLAGGWTALVLPGPSAQADHTIVFPSCEQPTSSDDPPPSPEASPSPTPTPTPAPPPECTPKENEVIRGTRKVSFEVQGGGFSSGIRQVFASLRAETSGVPHPGQLELTCPFPDDNPDVEGCQYNERRGSGIYSFLWNANTLTPYNGSYTLRVQAHACNNPLCTDQHEESLPDRQKLKVNNAPAGLGKPRILVATENSVTVEWDKGAEPDILSYTLYRAFTADSKAVPADNKFKAVFTTTATALRDEVGTPGAYWYKVRVTRRSVITPDTGISSPISERSGPGVVVGLEATPRPEGAPPPPPPPPRRLRPHVASRPPPVPDAPFSALLPYDVPDDVATEPTGPDVPEEGADPRGPVLPLAVGAFLVSASLALVRMPY